MLQHLKYNFFPYILTILLILTVSASYYRFMVTYDYLVSYEGDCDPYSESCYEYCEDDECTEPLHYTWITQSASTIKENCGDDVTMCDFAYECSPSEGDCAITYCDPKTEIEQCEILNESDRPAADSDINQINPD
ncbi:MAG: hypothetical protein ACI92I_000536 [Acidimicrobiales bacterium]|jgi:hypothetical protein